MNTATCCTGLHIYFADSSVVVLKQILCIVKPLRLQPRLWAPLKLLFRRNPNYEHNENSTIASANRCTAVHMASFKSLNHIYFSGRIILLEHFYVYIDIYCKNIGLDTWFSYMLVVSTFEVRTRTLDLLAQLLSM